MSEKSIRYIVYGIKAGIFILPILSLIVAGSFFFPFITGKNFFFRIMVEILFFLWVFVACFDKNYRPRKSSILLAISATLFFLTLATIFGANSYRSFWSNYERMEGLIAHIHLFLYFLVLTGVFKKEKDWKWFFIDLIGISFILAIYGFLQFFGILEVHQGGVRLDATLGNATYYAIFLIFHLFLIAWIFIKTKNWLVRSGLIFLFVLEIFLVFMTATRGAILGFLGGTALFAILIVILTKNKKIRYRTLGFFTVLLLIIFLFLLLRHSAFVKNNYVLARLANISFTETTVESRLTIWQMSLKGFLERPFLGWGPENYNLVFNKYYESKLYKQEPWFDRSHDIIFDWLISSGILGFLAYWSIWGAAIIILIKGYRKKYFTSFEVSLLAALFVAYAFHNLFVFDNLTSYFLFFSILGYLHFRYGEMQLVHVAEEDRENKKILFGKSNKPYSAVSENLGFLSYIIITLVFVAVVFSLYFLNLKPLLACRQLITTLGEIRTKGADVNFMLEKFNKVFSYNSFGNNEAREQLGNYAEQILAVSGISQEDKTKVVNKAIEEMKLQTIQSPNDARTWLFLTSLYEKAGQLEDALKSVNKASELSPKKQQIYFVIADIYLLAGQNKMAFEALQKAYDLDQTNSEAAKNLIIGAILNNNQDLANKIINETREVFGNRFDKEKQIINAYARMGNYKKVKEMWLAVLKDEPDNAQNHVSLAATYFQLGDRENTIKELQKAAELNPDFKQQADYYISEIRAGRNP